MKTASRYPSSNGLVERSVRIFKGGMKKLEGSPGTVHTKLSRIQINTPNNNRSYTSRAAIQPQLANATGSQSSRRQTARGNPTIVTASGVAGQHKERATICRGGQGSS